MPWRMPRLDTHGADVDDVGILQQARAVLLSVHVASGVAAFAGQVEPSARSTYELSASRDKVRMDVRLRDVRDPHLRSLGRANVLLGVAIRVENERLAGRLAAEEIARLRELVVVEAF